MMLRGFLLFAALFRAVQAAEDSNSPFECADGGVCTEWNDGCNDCANNGNGPLAMCTAKWCPCYEDDGCVPYCKDNPTCVPTKAKQGPAELEGSFSQACLDTAPFDCPEGEFCTKWNDGCNECGCNEGVDVAFCTLMVCPWCADDPEACVPTCQDNPACVPKQPVAEPEPKTYSEACVDSAPFDCPEGEACTKWNDGCNECGCNEGVDVAFCTMMMCPCLEDNSCVPTCKDNAACVPKVKEEPVAEPKTYSEACTDSAPFDCPEGEVCTKWNDGCNECGCNEGVDVAFCTMMMCPCLEDNSCVPTCKDNDACVPKVKEEPVAEPKTYSEACTDSAPFDCPEGEVCTEWNDGCNECGCNEGVDVAFCTMMMCPCLEDNSCVPTCKDNAACVPKEPVAVPEPKAYTETCVDSAPFDCPGGEVCTEWNDGCNECGCGEGADVAFCTMMMCPCYEDDSCVPTCKDNAACVPKEFADTATQVFNSENFVGEILGDSVANMVGLWMSATLAVLATFMG